MSLTAGKAILLSSAAGGGYEVSRSLRFNSSDGAFCSRTPASAGNRKTWTWSGWIKLAVLNSGQNVIFSATDGTTPFAISAQSSGQILFGNLSFVWKETTAVFRDHSAWYHFCVAVDTNQASNANRLRFYVNGIEQTAFSTNRDLYANTDLAINGQFAHEIGRYSAASNQHFNGYLAECHLIDGQQLTPSSFAETDATTGQWIPKLYSGSYGTNGFKLTFADNSAATATTLGKDTSGNSNNWTPNNFSVFNGNGTYSTGTITAGSSDGSISQAFNGVLVRTVNAAGITTASGNLLTYTLPSTINYSSKVEIAAYNNSAGTGYAGLGTGDPTGGTSVPNVSTGNSVPWTTLATGSGSFTAVSVRNSAERVGWVGLRIDGVTVLVDYSAGAGNDSLVDTPTSYGTDTGAGGEVRGNYATINPLSKAANASLSNGNLDVTNTVSGSAGCASTIGVSSGKWYCEVTVNAVGSETKIGICKENAIQNEAGSVANSWAYGNNGEKFNTNVNVSYGNSFTTGDVIGIAFDADAGSLYFYKNGTVQNSGTAAYTSLTSGPYFFQFTARAVGSANNLSVNFGQRAFAYTVPSGFKALVDTNLTAPVVAKPNTVMDVVLYTGTGAALTPTSSLGFNPDWIWIKSRSAATDHALYDVVRGAQARLESNTTDAEVTTDGGVTAFNSAGFTLGTLAQVNTSSATYAAWCWDAGTSTVTNTAGSITSSVRANASAGFSVVTYSGTGTTGTVGHGGLVNLDKGMIIVKTRTGASVANWMVYHGALGATKVLEGLNTTSAAVTDGSSWDNTAPTSTVFTVGGSQSNVNGSGRTFVAYCFAPVAGYGNGFSYTGNGSTDGSFVYLGFRPRLILVKRTDTTGNWTLLDTAREGYNVDNDPLYPNLSDAEGTADLLDITSNGFKLRSTDASVNANTGTYVGFAWAENPFQYARAR